jgi:hypothetical protein
MHVGAHAALPPRRLRPSDSASGRDNHLKTGDLDHLMASRTSGRPHWPFFNLAPPQVSIIRRAENGKATRSRPCGDIAICGGFPLSQVRPRLSRRSTPVSSRVGQPPPPQVSAFKQSGASLCENLSLSVRAAG